MMRRIGLLFALAALSVNAPRLMLLYLEADGLALPAGVEGAMLMLTGLATGAVLTGGGMYLAHVLARGHQRSIMLRGLLILTWLALLVFMVILLTPMLMIGLRRTGLAEILTVGWQWTWSVTAVLSVEVLAAGAMIANAVAGEPARPTIARRHPGRWERLLDAATDRAVDRLTPDPQPATDRVNGKVVQAQPSDLAQLEQASAVRAAGKEAALEALLSFYTTNPTASQSEAGQAIGRAKSTVGGYLAELEDAGLVERGPNGQGVIVKAGREVR
jgi:hypothetical protein